jgi:transcriptional regulator with XRE-family HTH domain
VRKELLRGSEKHAIEAGGTVTWGSVALVLNDRKKQRLSERLRSLMDEKGLSVSVAARLVQEQLPGVSFNPANISHYRAGRSMPRPNILKALSAVLEVDPEELAPSREGRDDSAVRRGVATKSPTEAALQNEISIGSAKKAGSSSAIPQFQITDLPNGEALLQINQKLSWPTVIRILQVLKGEIQGGD